EYLVQEIDNVVAACNAIIEHAKRGDAALAPQRICEFNKLVLAKLDLGDGVIPGEPRKHSVAVGRVYRGAPAEDCGYLLDRLCSWLNGPEFAAEAGLETVYAILKAVVAHLYLAWIHPFGDGNGRTARLVEFHVLLGSGVPTPAAHLLSNHYNQTRQEYYRQLDRASKSGGDVVPFIEYATRGFVDGLREQLELIRDQQWDVAWRSYVHERFREANDSRSKRQRDLLLDLSIAKKSVPIAKLTELTPRLARTYTGTSPKTLQRDLADLGKMGLVERNAEGVVACRHVFLAFLPWRKSGPGACRADD
ncbi:MAG: Fic family protein, partial [Deltaproteobacteria bacterium]|nr:Fic family protein [Deltaproteobacteria bacterium]